MRLSAALRCYNKFSPTEDTTWGQNLELLLRAFTDTQDLKIESDSPRFFLKKLLHKCGSFSRDDEKTHIYTGKVVYLSNSGRGKTSPCQNTGVGVSAQQLRDLGPFARHERRIRDVARCCREEMAVPAQLAGGNARVSGSAVFLSFQFPARPLRATLIAEPPTNGFSGAAPLMSRVGDGGGLPQLRFQAQ